MKNVLKNRLSILLALALVLSMCQMITVSTETKAESVGLEPVTENMTKAASSDFEIVNGVLKKYVGTAKKSTITIPKGVKEIQYDAFSPYTYTPSYSYNSAVNDSVKAIKRIIIPSSVKKIDRYSLSTGYLQNLTNIEVDSSSKYFKSGNGMLLNASGSEILEIPSGLTSIVIPNKVKDISRLQIPYNATKLKIGKNVKAVTSKSNPFGSAISHYKLVAITCHADNKYFTSEKGVLYNKTKTKIIKYPKAKTGSTYKIGSKVTSIGYAAFISVNNLKKITVPKSVKKVEGLAFSIYKGNGSLKIYFEGKAPSIEKYAFDYSYNVTGYYPKKYASSWSGKTKAYARDKSDKPLKWYAY